MNKIFVFNYLDEEYLHMHAQVTTAVTLAFFSPSCFSGYYVNSELEQNSLFGSFQYSNLYNLTRVYREYEFCKLKSLYELYTLIY